MSAKEQEAWDLVYELNMCKIDENTIIFLVPSIKIERRLKLYLSTVYPILGLSLYRDDINDFWKQGILLKISGEMCYLAKEEFLYDALFYRANNMYNI